MEWLKEGLKEDDPWRKWGPYLSERQWGTVREDYSPNGDAWNYLSHDQARSRVYRWGEDGIAGISDDQQQLCFALALWNGVDPILKERLFGLTNSEGNHGEDVKEYYYYLDNNPTHSYMKYLYKYPQRPFPYEDLVNTNRGRNRGEPEYELLDTGVFNDDRYFDVFVEYAKLEPEDIFIRLTLINRGPEAAPLHVLPHLWCRNTWWGDPSAAKPVIKQMWGPQNYPLIHIWHPVLEERYLYYQLAGAATLFTDNETNTQRIFDIPNLTPYVKDSINDYLVHGQKHAVNPNRFGTKAAVHYFLELAPGETRVLKLRLTPQPPVKGEEAFYLEEQFQETFQARQQETDQFYQAHRPPGLSEDEALVIRQAVAGLLWSKQFYCYRVGEWQQVDRTLPPPHSRRQVRRNRNWPHLNAADVILMPDKWEYPWFAAWDLAFQVIALGYFDVDFAKQQFHLLTRQNYLHPNGQLPAYEWNFSDVNPPIHAHAALRVYRMEKLLKGQGDRNFLENTFHKLLMNFTWWVNRKDSLGNDIFEGGFLGLDNIGIFDRSAVQFSGQSLEQADGTSWMAMFCLDMLRIALELALENPTYQDLALKFYEHFLNIGAAMDHVGTHPGDLWDEEEGFFYDLLRLPGGDAQRLKLRSCVGLITLAATAILHADMLEELPGFVAGMDKYARKCPELLINMSNGEKPGVADRRLLAVFTENKLRRLLTYLLDENEFLSPYGIRSLSRRYKDDPYIIHLEDVCYRLDYEPGESTTGMFGGNSNWRGPIWMPLNFLFVESLIKLFTYFGEEFTVECPTGSGNFLDLWDVSREIGQRLANLFLRNLQGRRPVFGDQEKLQTDPQWRDYLLFYEYFNGDTGAGLGASHQTGWTALIARMIHFWELASKKEILRKGLRAAAWLR